MPEKRKILIVDDLPSNLSLMKGMLKCDEYEIYEALNGQEAIDSAIENLPDLILMDIMMPVMDGFEATKILKRNEKTQIIPIIMITALTEPEYTAKALDMGADDFVGKPIDVIELRARVRSLLKVKDYNTYMIVYQNRLEEEVEKRMMEIENIYKRIKESSLETIYLLSRAAEYKDQDTGIHIKRMSNYAALIARAVGLDKAMVERILYASSMHDVGKIGIPDKILMKATSLTPPEWNVMKMHTTIGYQILESGENELIKLGSEIALTHHEKWDGEGYPNGLKGEDIPLSGRICAVADVFDALTSKRPYKEAFSVDKSLGIIESERGKSFDPAIVDAFFQVLEEILDIKKRFRDKNDSLFFQMMFSLNER